MWPGSGWVGAVSLLIVMPVLAGCTEPNGASAEPAEPQAVDTAFDRLWACANEPAPDVPVDLTVWLPVGVSDADAEAVAGLIEPFDGIEAMTYVDQEATYDEFVDYFADDPAIVDLVTPDNLPTSFRVEFTRADRAQVMAAELSTIGQVDSTELRARPEACATETAGLDAACRAGPFRPRPRRLVAWIEPDTPDDRTGPLTDTIAGVPGVESVSYRGAAEAATAYTEEYADDEAMLDRIDTAQLMTRFDIETEPATMETAEQLASEVGGLASIITQAEVLLESDDQACRSSTYRRYVSDS